MTIKMARSGLSDETLKKGELGQEMEGIASAVVIHGRLSAWNLMDSWILVPCFLLCPRKAAY